MGGSQGGRYGRSRALRPSHPSRLSTKLWEGDCPVGSFREREKWLGTRSLMEGVDNGKVDSLGMDVGGWAVEG